MTDSSTNTNDTNGHEHVDPEDSLGNANPLKMELVSMTAKEAAGRVPDNIEWTVYPWIPAGCITEVDGKIKDGKTTFVANLVEAASKGTDFLGQPTKMTKVVYLTEQPMVSFKQVLKRARLVDSEDVLIVYSHLNQGRRWVDTAEEAVSLAIRIEAKLIVIDTLDWWANVEDENNSTEARNAMKALERAKSNGLAVILVRQSRKSGGDTGDSSAGSRAFGGAVDQMITIRDTGSSENARTITTKGRFSEDTPRKLSYALVDGYIDIVEGSINSNADTTRGLVDAIYNIPLPSTEEDAMKLTNIIE